MDGGDGSARGGVLEDARPTRPLLGEVVAITSLLAATLVGHVLIQPVADPTAGDRPVRGGARPVIAEPSDRPA